MFDGDEGSDPNWMIMLTWASTDVVESKVGDAWVELEEEGQWLTDTTSSTENSDLGKLQLETSVSQKSFSTHPKRGSLKRLSSHV